MRPSTGLTALIALLASCGFGLSGHASESNATIRAVIVDVTGASIGNASVRLLPMGHDSVERETGSSPDGTFSFDRVFPGEFTLKIKAPGFREAVMPHLRVDAGKTKEAGTVTLQIADCHDPSVICCLQVTAAAPETRTR